MKYKAIAGALVAGSVAVMLTACGGGGGGGGDASEPGLTVSGTAAIGTALAGAEVEVQCLQGSGIVLTQVDGSYSITLNNGVMPCLVQARGTSPDGAPVVLHSAAFGPPLTFVPPPSFIPVPPAGKGTKQAVANVTPVTELALAQALAKKPSEQFRAPVDQALAERLALERLNQAMQQILGAMAQAGLNMGDLDPFKSQLKAAHANVRGNAHDEFLDRLMEMLRGSAFDMLVNQVAIAAARNDDAKVVADAVAGGALAGCPTAVSGQYRTLDLWGKTVVRDLDFKAMRMRAANGTDWLALTANPSEACAFVANGIEEGRTTAISVVLGAQGAGAFLSSSTGLDSVNGYIFPVQPHGASALEGEWSFMNSGYFPGQGPNHYPGRMTFDAAAGTVAACGYDTDTTPWTCNVSGGQATLTARTDGGFDITAPDSGDATLRLYGYRAPSGSLTLFGSQLMGDPNDSGSLRSSMIGARLATLPLPATGSVQKYWNIEFTSNDYEYSSTPPKVDTVTVDGVDTLHGAVMRHRASDGRQDTLLYNQPLAGTRLRLPGADYAAAIQIPLPGLDMVITANAEPAADTGIMFHVLSVVRP